jgi:ferredoxin
MAHVRVVPADLSFVAASDTTIFTAAHEAGLRWPTICEGQGTCHTCVMRVVEGVANLSPIEAWEREGLQELGLGDESAEEPYRLACQARVHGDVVVRRAGVRANDPKG